jgi:hypothetical protein
MRKKISYKEITQAATNMNAKDFMKTYGESAQIEIYEAEDILNYNDGFLSLKFHGLGKTDYMILFINGRLDSIEEYNNAGC